MLTSSMTTKSQTSKTAPFPRNSRYRRRYAPPCRNTSGLTMKGLSSCERSRPRILIPPSRTGGRSSSSFHPGSAETRPSLLPMSRRLFLNAAVIRNWASLLQSAASVWFSIRDSIRPSSRSTIITSSLRSAIWKTLTLVSGAFTSLNRASVTASM